MGLCNFKVLTLTQNKKQNKGGTVLCVFLTLPDDCNGGICWSYLGRSALLGPLASVTPLIAVFLRHAGVYFYSIFWSVFTTPVQFIAPAAQSSNFGSTDTQTDRQTCGRSL